MDSYLMGAACFQTKGDKAVPISFFYNTIMSNGSFALVPVNRPLNDGSGLSGKGSIDCPGFWGDMSPDNGKVFPMDISAAHHIG